MHGANHKVSCDQGQLAYVGNNNFGLSKVYYLDKAYRNSYQWPIPGIPYKDWLKAKNCEFYTDSATFVEGEGNEYKSEKIRRGVVSGLQKTALGGK